MDATNGILCPIPEDERTPFVDVLLKFIDWQKVRIENAEEENKQLKKELVELRQLRMDVSKKKTTVAQQNTKKKQQRQKVVFPLKIQHQNTIKPKSIQQLLVKNIQQLLVSMGSKNKRQFTRLYTHLDANIDFGSQQYNKRSVQNISLGGLYVTGRFNQRPGDICTISLNQSELEVDLEIHATCSVIRGSVNGMALEFTSMKLDDFCHLQAILLYEADDPFVLGTEFVNNMDIELENDLILCNRVAPK